MHAHPFTVSTDAGFVVQVADPVFLMWAIGRLTGVTSLHVLPCHSAGDKVPQLRLTTGALVASTHVRRYTQWQVVAVMPSKGT